MNVEIGTEAAQFLEKEYINGVFIAVHILQERKVASVLNIAFPLLRALVYKRRNLSSLPPTDRKQCQMLLSKKIEL
jgi:hypothetical protein